MTLLLVALGFLFFAAVAMTVNEGLWNNTITFLCLVISGLAGATAGVPLGMMILEQTKADPEYTWYCVFAGMWAVFVVTMVVLRLLTDRASKIRVRFIPLVDKIGGFLMCGFVATMLEGFAAFTLLVAPLQSGAWNLKAEDRPKIARMQKAASPFILPLTKFTSADQIDYPLLQTK